MAEERCRPEYRGVFVEVWKVLTGLGHLTREGAWAWLVTESSLLEGAAPIDLVNMGRGYEVRNAAYLMVRGS